MIANLYTEFTVSNQIGSWTALFNICIYAKKETMSCLISKGDQVGGEGVFIANNGKTISSMNDNIPVGDYSLNLIFIPL